MQAVTIDENIPSRSKYAANYNVCAATSTAVIFIVSAIGAALCGAIIYIPLSGVYPPDVYQIIAFIEGGVYLLTAFLGFATIRKLRCTILVYMVACILCTLVSLSALGWYSYHIYQLSQFGIFSWCEEMCLYITVPVCMLAFISVMGFITALIGSIYCCKGVCSDSDKRSSSDYNPTAPDEAPAPPAVTSQ